MSFMDDVEFGSILYRVRTNNNYLSRKKITMTDSEGVEWFRYDRPSRTYTVDVYEYVGRSLIDIQGISVNEIPDEFCDIDTYFLRNKRTNVIEMEYHFDTDDWFKTICEAKAYVDRENAKEE